MMEEQGLDRLSPFSLRVGHPGLGARVAAARRLLYEVAVARAVQSLAGGEVNACWLASDVRLVRFIQAQALEGLDEAGHGVNPRVVHVVAESLLASVRKNARHVMADLSYHIHGTRCRRECRGVVEALLAGDCEALRRRLNSAEADAVKEKASAVARDGIQRLKTLLAEIEETLRRTVGSEERGPPGSSMPVPLNSGAALQSSRPA